MHRLLSAFRLRAFPLLTLAAAAACDDPSGPGGDDPDPVPPAVASVVVVDTAGSIFRSVEVTLDSAGRVEVFYAPVAGGRVFRMRADSSAPYHEILLPRLRQATEYNLSVRSYIDATVSDSVHRSTFSTDSLPTELNQFNYSVEGTSTFEVLIVPFRSTALGWAGQVAIDSDGEIVWFMESVGGTLVAAPVPGTHDMVFIENGFPSDGGRNGIVRANPEGEVVALLERDAGLFGQIHHDMTAVDDDRVLFLAYDTMTVRDTLVNGEAVWEWHMSTGAVEKKWSSWDFFDWDTERGPGSSPAGWLHANSITIGPRGNVVVSSRSFSQVFSISADFQSIEYRVGGPAATVRLSEDDRFVSQHSAWELPGNRLLLFDNQGAGTGSSLPTSRALELQLQLDSDTAFMVWQYDPEPDISSPLRGGVYRLASGNTVTIFASNPFKVHETTTDGAIVWSMTGDITFTNTFRAVPWASIAGEVEVETLP